MKNSFISLAVILMCGATAALAQAPASSQLTPAPERISDQAIATDHGAYKQLQGRLQQLNERGLPVRDYHLSKAQCWLDVSLHEYTRNDRSAFPQASMTESEKLIVALEKKLTPLPMNTPLVNDAARLRPDLWARTDALKQHEGFKCAWQQVACAEVELVHAGNEHNQQQWRHAKPYVQIAEELVSQANELVAQCIPESIAPKVVVTPAPVPVPAPVPQAVALQARVLFDFDKYTPEHIRPASRAELDQLSARVKREGVTVQTLSLTGHADRLNSTGNNAYNQQLSQKRVNTVRDLLAAQGLVVSSVAVDARGDREQIEACQRQFTKQSELKECLLPNRRVQIELTGTKPAEQL
jgi:outer membrane protein OmpA-like peptidoglycan-associated protein